MIVEIKVPSPGESITEVEIASWLKQDGEYVEKDEEVAEIESDKATLTIAAEASGKLQIKVEAGTTIEVGTVICTIDTDAKSPSNAKSDSNSSKKSSDEKTADSNKEEASSEKKYAAGSASPAAQKMMKEKSISKEQVDASGKDGRITKGDVIKASSSVKKDTSTESIKRTDHQSNSREVKRVKMSMLRKKLAQRLVAVKNETAMLTTFNEVDMSAIIDIRKKYKDQFKEAHGVGLGFMSFFTKAVCEALQHFPDVNAMIDNDQLIYHEYCDIGIAVSAPKGLMVPVIRNAESMSLAEIEKSVMQLAAKARDGKITLDEMTGGTFTITNGGVFGSMLSTPIINPPQSAILGMHNIVERPVAINGKVEIRPVMYVALSYDHRIIDGKQSVGFLVKVKQMLEQPSLMLFQGNDPVKHLLDL